jgi:hypothetical protein
LQHAKGGWLEYARLDCGTLRASSIEYNPWASSTGHNFDSSWGSQDGTDWVKEASAMLRGAPTNVPCPPDISAAYSAARQARFEHGESGEGHA